MAIRRGPSCPDHPDSLPRGKEWGSAGPTALGAKAGDKGPGALWLPLVTPHMTLRRSGVPSSSLCSLGLCVSLCCPVFSGSCARAPLGVSGLPCGRRRAGVRLHNGPVCRTHLPGLPLLIMQGPLVHRNSHFSLLKKSHLFSFKKALRGHPLTF